MTSEQIAQLIDESPMNRGLVGAEWMASDGNIAAANDAGDVLLFGLYARGMYEFHWLRMLTKGRKAIDYTIAAFDEIFQHTKCHTIFGLVPDERRDSKFMARWIGAKSGGLVDTAHGICELFVVTREMWEGV